MPVNRIRRVRIRPGDQRVTVMLEADRIRFARPALSWSDLWEIPFYLGSLVGMMVLVGLGATAIVMGYTVAGWGLVAAGLIVGMPVLFALFTDAMVFVVVPALLVVGLVMVFFPAGRRRWKELWSAEPDEPGEISYFDIAALSIEDEWNRTTVVVQRHGADPVALVATGPAGRRLRRALPDVPLPRTILRRDWRTDPRFRDIA